MGYKSDSDRWLAFKTNDPFAISSFFICNPTTLTVCRPNCDVHNVNVNRSEIVFTEDIGLALAQSYVPCVHSLPEYASNHGLLKRFSFSAIDIELLKETVRNVNTTIGFDSEATTVADKSKLCSKHNSHFAGGNANLSPANSDDLNVSELANEHRIEDLRFNLIVTACRHLALAALASFSDISIADNVINGTQHSTKEKDKLRRGNFTMNAITEKRRKGGVLGFKELAQKCNMSAWHFHRVFKSIAGVTPKAYGDECAKYIKEHSNSQEKKFLSGEAVIISSIVTGKEESQLKLLRESTPTTCNLDKHAEGDDNQLYNVPPPKRKQLSTCGSSCTLDSLNGVTRRNTVPALAHRITLDSMVPMQPLKQSSSTYSLRDPTAGSAFHFTEDTQNFKNTNSDVIDRNASIFASFEGTKVNYNNSFISPLDFTPPTSANSITNFSNETNMFEPPFTDFLDPLMMASNEMLPREYQQQHIDLFDAPILHSTQPPTLNETFLLNQLRRHSELEKLERQRSVEYSTNSTEFDDIFSSDIFKRNEHLDI